jgi:hypothetical protein
MSRFLKCIFLFGIAFIVSSCAALYNIDEPTIGVIAKDQIPAFQKSVRCELVTFFEINQERRRRFESLVANGNREEAVARYKYFDLDTTLYGALELDLKVVDTGGFPSTGGSNFTNRIQTIPPTGTPVTAKTAIFSPSLTDQNTYEWQWWYLIPQNSTLYRHKWKSGGADTQGPTEDVSENYECYRAVPENDLRGLANGNYPELEQFTRIRINGGLPFAAWLEENGAVMGTAFFATNYAAEKKEHLIPAQMFYNFMIQVSGGINASFSLVSTHWNPLAPVATLQQQQTNNLQIWINGSDAALVGGAKTGTSTAKITPQNNTAPFARGVQKPTIVSPCTKNGCLLFPLPLNGPSPTPNQPPP